VVFPAIGCEVGVLDGDLSVALLERYEDLVLYMVDCFKEYHDYDEIRMKGALTHSFVSTTPYADRRIMFLGKSVQVTPLIKDESLDFVYIDANHKKVPVCTDINAWCPKVKPGGFVSGHDYTSEFPGVVSSIDRFAEENCYTVNEVGNHWWFVKDD